MRHQQTWCRQRATYMLGHWSLLSWNPEPTMLEEAQHRRPHAERIPAIPAEPRHWLTQQITTTSYWAQAGPTEVPSQSKETLRSKLFWATKCLRMVCYATIGSQFSTVLEDDSPEELPLLPLWCPGNWGSLCQKACVLRFLLKDWEHWLLHQDLGFIELFMCKGWRHHSLSPT